MKKDDHAASRGKNLKNPGGSDMKTRDLEHLKEQLLRRRWEIFNRLQGVETDWEVLSARDIEMEEEAQKTDLAALFGQLEEMEQKEINEIDRALAKMAAAEYGTCEKCGKSIALERLATLPAARFCKRCAREAEKRTPGTVA
jgi:DnaK suppressor protein